MPAQVGVPLMSFSCTKSLNQSHPQEEHVGKMILHRIEAYLALESSWMEGFEF